jgi:hypothetical protein
VYRRAAGAQEHQRHGAHVGAGDLFGLFWLIWILWTTLVLGHRRLTWRCSPR